MNGHWIQVGLTRLGTVERAHNKRPASGQALHVGCIIYILHFGVRD